MSKTVKLQDVSGNTLSSVPKVKGVKPVGSQVYIELLTPQEILGTSVIVGGDSSVGGAPQAYILELGPRVQSEEWGFNTGSRVVLSGNFTPLPEAVCDNGRARALVEPHTIKAVLVE